LRGVFQSKQWYSTKIKNFAPPQIFGLAAPMSVPGAFSSGVLAHPVKLTVTWPSRSCDQGKITKSLEGNYWCLIDFV